MQNSQKIFAKIDSITEYNQQKVLDSFIRHRISEAHFAPTTGYGYGDRGRDTLEKLFAHCVGAEDSLVRHSFASGTHTITVALFGVLRPGDKILCISGTPYDTLHGVLGIGESRSDGSLADFEIGFEQVDLLPDDGFDFVNIEQKIAHNTYKMIYIQRSRGYDTRPSIFVSEIEKAANLIRKISPDSIVMVDNCYGEFVETREPTEAGADLMAGSLIKNPGGGIAPSGGYIAGRKDLVELCAQRMTAPGVGREVGASLGHSRDLYMGLFSAPHVTGEALKTAVFAAFMMSELGFAASPAPGDERTDIIQCLFLRSPENIVEFCRGLQSGAPVDSFVTPEPWEMPGYVSKVIMSAGTFTGGSSIELSADAPIREPYCVWLQGGLNFHSAKAAVMRACEGILELNNSV